MGNKKKFDKLEVNENYYKTHAEEEVSKPQKNKKREGMFLDIDSKRVPEKQKLSKTFTYTKERRRMAGVREQESELEAPAKAPFVLMIIVVLLAVAAGFVTQSTAFKSMPERNAAIGNICLMIGIYVVPTIVYMVSSSERRRLYNIRPFSFSMLSTALICLGLVVSLSMLQRYFITYTFGYSVPVSAAYRNVLLTVLVGALVPAICQELFFRGVLQYEISKYAGGLCGTLICGLLFAVIHFDLQYFTVYLVSGIVLSALAHLTHSVFPSMIVHFLSNTISIFFSDKLMYIALRRVGGTLSMIILASLAFLFLIFLLRHAENISNKRAMELTSENDEETDYNHRAKKIKYDEARFFLSPNGRTVSRLAKTFSSPFIIAAVVVFIVVVVIKQNM